MKISTNTGLLGTNQDTEIALYALPGGNCNNLASLLLLACHQDISTTSPINYLSEIQASSLIPGQTYYVQASGWGNVQGTFCIEVKEPPANDDLCDAISLTVGSPCVNGNNTDASNQSNEPVPACFSGGSNSVWYKFIAPSTGIATITTTTTTNTEIALYALQGSCSNLTSLQEIACNQNDGQNVSSKIDKAIVVPGQTYFVQLSGFNGAAGAFCIKVETPDSPPNDDLCDAIPLVLGASCTSAATHTNEAATMQAAEPEPFCFEGGVNSVWYSFTAASLGDVTITTNTAVTGTLTNTEIALYTLPGGNCSNLASLQEVECNQDVDPNNLLSVIQSATVNPGWTYYIQVSGASGANGTFCIEVKEAVPLLPPVNDSLCNAIPLIVGASCDSLNGDNTRATIQAGEPVPSCFVGGVNSVWYRFVAPPSGWARISTNTVVSTALPPTNDNTEIAIYGLPAEDCSDFSDLQMIGCSQDLGGSNFLSEVNVEVQSGEIYYVQVSGHAGTEGTFCIEISEISPITVPPNDDLCQADTLVVGQPCGPANGNNSGASFQLNEPASVCFQGLVRSVWYTFMAPPSGLVRISGSNPSTEFALYSLPSGDCSLLSDLVFLECHTDVGQSDLLVPVSAGQSYYIQVSGKNDFQGAFCLSVVEEIPQIIYVNQNNPVGGNGSSWATAFRDLPPALASASRYNQIFVARGIYKPTSTTSRSISFNLPDDVMVFGGFTGTETSLQDRATDSLSLHVQNRTVLSGNIGDFTSRTDNSLHVVRAHGTQSLLDGFTISDGYAVSGSSQGGGIDCFQAHLTVNNCIISQNYATNWGGGMYTVESSIFVNNCSFVSNESALLGGGIYTRSINANSVISNSLFVQNRAQIGGAVRNFWGTPQFKDCLFTLNEALPASNSTPGSQDNSFQRGGAVANSSFEEVSSFVRCTFSQNKADDIGGGIHNDETMVLLDSCTFTENVAGLEGGAAQIENNSIIRACTFADNFVSGSPITYYIFLLARGGAISVEGGAPLIESSHFAGNISTRLGGALYNLGGDLTIHRSSFVNNTSNNHGGGLYTSGGFLNLSHCQVEGNHANLQGGGIYSFSSVAFVDSCQIEKNTAKSGGGMYSVDGLSQLSNCNFIENTALPSNGIGEGGALFTDGIAEFDNCEFRNNSANLGGAVIVARTPIFKSCQFSQNIAQNSAGGAIYTKVGGAPSLMECVFSRNQAGTEGGAIFLNGGSPKMIRCTLFQNEATLGGGIHATDTELTLLNCTLSDNRAKSPGSGGGFRLLGGSALLNACTLYQNKSNKGGSIDIAASAASAGIVQVKNSVIDTKSSGENVRITQGQLLSLGHNLFGFLRPTLGFNPTFSDIVGTPFDPIDPQLDSLRMNGGKVPTHATLPGSPLLEKGESILQTDLRQDQRGYSRLIGSTSSFIDIGAFESQHSFLLAPDRRLCLGDPSYSALEDIVFIDSTGGAFREGEHLSLEFMLPSGLTFQQGRGSVFCEGNGLKDCELIVGTSSLTLSYSRNYDTLPNSIHLRELQVRADASAVPGEYNLLLSGGDAVQYGNQLEDSLPQTSFLLLPLTKISDLPYDESFESEPEFWISEGENSSWEWGQPAGTVINQASEGERVWMTGLSSFYLPDENSYVSSPCFDLSSLQQPMIALDIWTDTEDGFDGAVLQASTDAGDSWEVIGTNKTGVNWYQTATLFAEAGSQSTPGNFGWTGHQTGWQRAIHRLDHLKDSSAVRFRLAFASVGTVDTSQVFNGFAFDNLFIGERSRKVLLEHYSDDSRTTDNQTFQSIAEENPSDVVPMQLHIIAGDEFFEKNPAGPRARALYYGISESGISIAGGNGYLGRTSQLTQQELDLVILRDPVIDISIDSTQSSAIAITARKTLDTEVVVLMAIVENVGDHLHVLRRFLPNVAGLSYPGWPEGITERMQIQWQASDFPPPSIVDNYDSLRLIVFVQNRETKEVYQAASSPVWEILVKRSDVEGREGELPGPATDLRIYPNPSSGLLWIDFGKINEQDFQVHLIDMRGRSVLRHWGTPGQDRYSLDLKDLASGMYYLHLQRDGHIFHREKVVVRR